ncbi:MAG: hypothetical protein ACREIC_25470 [Limisphaerales bacterium]
MTQEAIRALTDSELSQVVAWAQSEIKARTERRKQETIAKIKELAGAVGVSVAIGGVRGRPAQVRAKPAPKH